MGDVMVRSVKSGKLSPKAEAYRVWVDTGLELPEKTQKGLAIAIGRSEGTVSKMRSGERRVQLEEVDAIADYFGPGHPPPNGRGPRPPPSTLDGGEHLPPTLSVEAVIAPGFWRGVGAAVDTSITYAAVPGRPEPKFAQVRQYACAFRADPLKFVICAPFAAMRSAPLQDDEVHVRRTRANGEHEDTVRIVKISGGKIRLVIEGDAEKKDRSLSYPSKRAGEQIELRGLVIGTFIAKSV